jgi:hypothetical protein
MGDNMQVHDPDSNDRQTKFGAYRLVGFSEVKTPPQPDRFSCFCKDCSGSASTIIELPIGENKACLLKVCDSCVPKFASKGWMARTDNRGRDMQQEAAIMPQPKETMN